MIRIWKMNTTVSHDYFVSNHMTGDHGFVSIESLVCGFPVTKSGRNMCDLYAAFDCIIQPGKTLVVSTTIQIYCSSQGFVFWIAGLDRPIENILVMSCLAELDITLKVKIFNTGQEPIFIGKYQNIAQVFVLNSVLR